MSEENTQNIDGGRTFEERVFGRFDAIDVRFDAVETGAKDTNLRLEILEARTFDTKPIWEQVLKEIVETKRELSKRLDRIVAIMLENRADIRDVEDRIEKLEIKPI